MQEIKTTPKPHCVACGGNGVYIHKQLTDRLFNTPGFWDMKKCVNPNCSTVWLDPAPQESEIPKLYTSYYTHQDLPNDTAEARTTFLDKIRAAHLHSVYAYDAPRSSWLYTLLGKITYIHPAWKDNLESTVFYLPKNVSGRLLEVGCGAGATLQAMTKKGWVTTGTDFDPGAVANAKNKGLDVYCGELSDQKFADESFDAIVMSHVIEHVPHPTELLTECHRVLKKDGVLVVLTPNARARGFNYYGRNWFALDTPRHLQIFTAESLGIIASNVGYRDINTFTSMHLAIHIWQMSSAMASDPFFTRGSKISIYKRIIMQFAILTLGWIHTFFPGKGEVSVLMCKK